MRRETILLLASDLVLIACATLLAFLLRDSFDGVENKIASWAIYIGLTVAVAFFVFLLAGINRSVYRFANLNDYLWLSSLTVIVVAAALAAGFVLNRLDGVARTMPVLQAILIIAALVVARVGYRLLHARRTASALPRHAERNAEDVLVIGVNPVADLYIRAVDDLARGQIRIHGVVCVRGQQLKGRRIGTHRILGDVGEIEEILQRLKMHGVDVTRIVVTNGAAELSEIDRSRLAMLDSDRGIGIDFFAERLGFGGHGQDFESRANDQQSVEDMAGAGVQRPHRVSKRLFDLVLATGLLILLWPLIIVVALIVWLDVGRPLLFWQQRPGLGGRPIRVYKFRTMGPTHDVDGNRIPDHQRLSAIGEMLRSKRLDELPQLFNILVGDMSFVGPRPLLPIDQPMDRRDRLSAKPGLTGWAQVVGGRTVSPGDKAALDRWYVENMSLRLDIEILFRTIPVVLFGERVDAMMLRKACDAIGRVPDLPEARMLGSTNPHPGKSTAGAAAVSAVGGVDRTNASR